MLIEFSGRNEIPASYLGYAEAELWVDGFAGGLRSKWSPLCSLWCPQPERRWCWSCTASEASLGMLEVVCWREELFWRVLLGALLLTAALRAPGQGRGCGQKQREKKKTGQNLRDLFWYIIETENQKHLIDTIQYLNRVHQNDFWICSLIWHLWTFWVVSIF